MIEHKLWLGRRAAALGRCDVLEHDHAAPRGVVDAAPVAARRLHVDGRPEGQEEVCLAGKDVGAAEQEALAERCRSLRVLDMGARCAVGMERARSVIPAALYGRADRMWKGTQKGLDICTNVLPRTLLHGDSHAGQTYVTADERMGLTDWQATMQGGWSYDVAYFIGSACEPDDRREWETELIAFYLDELATAGGKAPDFDEAFLRYRQSLFYPYSAWAFTIGRAFYQPRMQPDHISLAIIERLSTAIDDLDSLAAVGV